MILPILNIIRKLVNNMHKSSIIGFFLVSSLIFGSGNMMILQGAAAQDYYNDDTQYMDWEDTKQHFCILHYQEIIIKII